MNQNEFMREQQAAVERMREMNSRAQINHNTSHKMPPVPSFVQLNENTNTHSKIKDTPQKENKPHPLQSNQSANGFGGFKLPFIDSILTDGDSTLILGLLLLLMSEKSDKLLLFALVYILL